MADVAAPIAPAAAPAAAPAPAAPAAPAAEAPSGISAAMKGFNEAITPKAKGAEPAKPSEPAKEPAKPVEPAKEPAEPDLWEKAPGKLKGEHFKMRRQFEEKIQSYESRVKELEGKAKEAPGDVKLIEKYQTDIKEMQQRLAAADYRQSQEFQKQFIAPWQSEYKAAVGEISKLQLTINGADGETTQRQATEADFTRIMNLPPGEQDQVISALFGPYANRVFSRLFRLQGISQSAEEAITQHAQTAETTAKEHQLAQQREEQEYQKHFDQSDADLRKQWPQFFDVDEKDPEVSKAMQSGYEYVDNILKTAETLPLDQRAAYNAVIRGRAAAMPRLALQLNRANVENESLKAELKKLRGSDPGDGERGEHGGGAPVAGDDGIPQGIAAASKAIKFQ